MIHCIVGTAGHIDHGKTALVRALTGIDTDRLEEEKRRGISIDLGFAHATLDGDVQCGFVDVPGHERFVKNMLAGVGGIDIVLLVIAADESIKPQTREHFDICRLLGVTHGIVVLTKADLVDAELLDLVKLEAEEFVAGSFLEGAPVVAVSAVSGLGLGELQQAIAAMARRLPPRDTSHEFRLPVDRAFAMKGFGTVVTGTLVAGHLRLDQEIEIYPMGLRARVRGLQVHGQNVPQAVAGQRTAVNLGGVSHDQLRRGMVLAPPGLFVPTKAADCVLDLLASAKPLKHRAPVHLHAGAAEVEAEVRLAQGTQLDPGGHAYARLVLREPLLLLPGDRFILRKFSPVVTIAGGRILDPAPPRKPAAGRWLALENGSWPERLAWLVREARWGMSWQDLAARTGLTRAALQTALNQSRLLLLAEQQWAVDQGAFAGWRVRLKEALAEFHRANPLQLGMLKEDLRSRELPLAPPFLLDALVQSDPGIVAQGELLRLASHQVSFQADEQEAVRRIEAAFAAAGLAAPAAHEVLRTCGVDAARARNLLQLLLREKRLVKVSEELFLHAPALEQLRSQLAARKGTRFGVAEFKDWTGVSRKYAIPLLEYFDRERVTRRDGDARVVL